MKNTKANGFTILEVLLGMAVFMLGMLGIAAMLISSVKGADFSAKVTEALVLASNQQEFLKRQDYSDALGDLQDTDNDGLASAQDADNDGVDDSGDNFGLDDVDADADYSHAGNAAGMGTNNRYRIFWNIAVNVPVPDCKTVKVIVSWAEKGDQRRISLTSVVTDNG